MNGLELGERLASGTVARPPVADLIGFDVERVAPGEAVVTFDAEARHANPMGTLHGGILCDIADAAMGVAYASGLNEGETFTTLETQDQFPAAGVERPSHREGRGEAAWEHGGVGGVRCDGRARSADRPRVEHVPDVARREG